MKSKEEVMHELDKIYYEMYLLDTDPCITTKEYNELMDELESIAATLAWVLGY